jgi:hypothetical protein
MGRVRTRDKRLPRNLYCRNGYYSYRHPVDRREYGLGRDRARAVLQANASNRTLAHASVESRIAEGLMHLLTADEIVAAAIQRTAVCGVYFLIDLGQVVYVGQSENLHKRLSDHIRQKEKQFDSFHFVECHPALINELEHSYIASLQPKYNALVDIRAARRPLYAASILE